MPRGRRTCPGHSLLQTPGGSRHNAWWGKQNEKMGPTFWGLWTWLWGGCDDSGSLMRSESLGGKGRKNSTASFVNQRLCPLVELDSGESQSLFFHGLASGVNEFKFLSLTVLW